MAAANRFLAFFTLGLIALCAVYLLGGSEWFSVDLRAGSPLGQSMGIIAGLILLGTLFYVRVRRSDDAQMRKFTAQSWHAVIGTLGTTLAILHSHASLREWSTLVLLAIIGLLATGFYGRVIAPLRVGAAFGRSAVPYLNTAQPDPISNEISELIRRKQALLKTFAGDNRESGFVLRWRHWFEHPRAALDYHRLTVKERRLLARHPLSVSTEIPLLERLWRHSHLILAGLFIVGLFAHVITTVFFAGYVADGREIYWWHLTKW